MLLRRFNSKLTRKHKCLTCFFCSFFLLFSFVLEEVFLLWHNDMMIYWVGQGIFSLAQWLDNPIYIVEVINGFHMNLALKNLIQKITWKLLKVVFWSQNWILLVVSFYSCLHKFVHMYVCFCIGIHKQ